MLKQAMLALEIFETFSSVISDSLHVEIMYVYFFNPDLH